MAVVDAKYRFLTVDIGAYGSNSDGGIFKSTAFGKAVENGSVAFPKDQFLPGSQTKVGHVLLGDEAFQLLPNFLRPYPQKQLNNKRRVFNYRLSRARFIFKIEFKGMLITNVFLFDLEGAVKMHLAFSLAGGEFLECPCYLNQKMLTQL